MADALPPELTLHQDADFFREAVRHTAARTGFVPRLIEKDYFCSVLLAYLAAAEPRLVFKGGTCLSKIHCGFFRLSEDLDFAISLPASATRKRRRTEVERSKSAVAEVAHGVPAFRVALPLAGANESAQYNGEVTYRSLVGGGDETIKIEISLREPVLLPAIQGHAATALLDPIDDGPLVPPVVVACLAYREAMAEKLRAALTRREVAIRDYFDLDHAVTTLGLDLTALIDLARQKVTIPGGDTIAIGPDRFAELHAQVETRLRPVLRPSDLERFDLKRVFEAVRRAAVTFSARQV
jgi:predicted nucleotidyltransferase component of viral defense system